MSLKKLLGQIDQMSLESGANPHPTIPGIMAPEVAADYLAEQAELAEVEADLDETLEQAEEVMDGEVLLESAIADLEEGGEDGSEPLSMESMYTLRGRVLEVTGQDIFANKPMSLESAQEMSLEGVKEILAAVKSAGGKVAGALGEQINWYMTKFFDGMGKAKKWLSAIDSKLGSAKGDPKGPIAVSKLFGRYLANDAGSIAPADVTRHLSELTKAMNGFEATHDKMMKNIDSKYGKRIEEIGQDYNSGKIKVVELFKRLSTLAEEIFQNEAGNLSKYQRKDGQTVEAVTVSAKDAKNVSKALAATISSFEGWKATYDKITTKTKAANNVSSVSTESGEVTTDNSYGEILSANLVAGLKAYLGLMMCLTIVLIPWGFPMIKENAIKAFEAFFTLWRKIFRELGKEYRGESDSRETKALVENMQSEMSVMMGKLLIRMAKYQNSVIKAGLVYLDNATKQLDIEVPAAPVTETPGGDAA